MVVDCFGVLIFMGGIMIAYDFSRLQI